MLRGDGAGLKRGDSAGLQWTQQWRDFVNRVDCLKKVRQLNFVFQPIRIFQRIGIARGDRLSQGIG